MQLPTEVSCALLPGSKVLWGARCIPQASANCSARWLVRVRLFPDEQLMACAASVPFVLLLWDRYQDLQK